MTEGGFEIENTSHVSPVGAPRDGVPAGSGPPGVDLARLTRWIDGQQPELRQGELVATAITGGRSNLTYRLTDGVSQWALRRPPLGHVLPTAHDMAREFRVISALYDSAVPVPRPVLLCTDRNILGEAFYLMSFVDGVLIERPDVVPNPLVARHTTELLVDTLVALHAVDPGQVGLDDFGRPDGFLQRQVSRWHKQFLSSVPGGSAIEESVVCELGARLPESAGSSIVHGDYRLTNVLFSEDLGFIEAVLDWEMATLGDPLTDLGLLYVYHELARHSDSVMPDFPAGKGFLSAQEMVDRYAAASGVEVAGLDWYIAFGYFKLAVVAAGIFTRFEQGKTVGEGFEVFGGLREATLQAAQHRLQQSGGS